MNKNKLNYSEIEDIIDKHFQIEEDIMFVVDKNLATYICNYIEDVYGLEDKNNELSTSVNEYYLTILFDGAEAELYCENAKSTSGKYKSSDVYKCDYFIGVNMSEEDCDKFLLAEIGIWSWFEIVNDDEDCCYECCDCEDDELTDDQKAELGLIYDFYNLIMEANGCRECTLKAILNMANTFKDIGIRQHQDYIRKLNERI